MTASNRPAKSWLTLCNPLRRTQPLRLEALEDRTTPATFVVDLLTDEDDGSFAVGDRSLREAIDQAEANTEADTILFADSLGTATITLTIGQLGLTDTSEAITIDGGGDITISGNNANRIFDLANGVTAELINLRLVDGFTSGDGGAVRNSGNLNIRSSTIAGSSAGAAGGGVLNSSGGTLIISNSTLSGNSSSFEGGGIRTFGTAFISNSTFSGNSAGFAGGGVMNAGTITISNSTFSGNSAGFAGGGVSNFGGMTLDNSIVANSISGGDLNNGGFATGSNNLIEDGVVPVGLIDTLTGDPLLGPLQDNGGLTFTQALLTGSLAINAGNNAGVPSGVTTDQRGEARIINGTVDIGAFEVMNQSPDITPQSFDIPENSPTATEIGTVNATDPDAGSKLSFAIMAGNGLGAFALNSTTGVLTVANPGPLNFETNPTFNLSVQVSDEFGGSDSAVVAVNLMNINEDAPTLNNVSFGPIAEGDPSSTVVGTLTAADPDADPTFTYTITGGNPGGDGFALNPATGVLTVNNGDSLDFETQPTVDLQVSVSDGLFNDTATVTVSLSNQAPSVVSLSGPSNLDFGQTWNGSFEIADPASVGSDPAFWSILVSVNDRPADLQIFSDDVRVDTLTNLSWDAFHAGPNTITLTVTDTSGAMDQQTLNVTVARPTVVYVDDDFAPPVGGDANGNGPGNYFGLFNGFGGDQFNNFADALAAVADNGRIVVYSGTYNEAINLTRGLELELRNPSTNVTIDSLAGIPGTTVDTMGGTLTVGDASNTNYAGLITGSGNLIKTGSGNFTLSGSNDFTGNLTLQQGTLTLNGSLNGDANDVLITGDNTRFQGSGSISGRGVEVRSSAQNVEITGVTITHPGDAAILVQSKASVYLHNTTLPVGTGANRFGIDVFGGTALILNNNINFNSSDPGTTAAGIRVDNGGIVDAGELNDLTTQFYYNDITGLRSNFAIPFGPGGNSLRNYPVFIPGTTSPNVAQAIRNLNEGLTPFPPSGVEQSNNYSRFSPQLGRLDMLAQGNTFGNGLELFQVEQRIFHDLDNGNFGFVTYGGGTAVDPATVDPNTMHYYAINPDSRFIDDFEAGMGQFSTDAIAPVGQASVYRVFDYTFDAFVFLDPNLLDPNSNLGVNLQKLDGPNAGDYTGLIRVEVVGQVYNHVTGAYQVRFGFIGNGVEYGSLADGNYDLNLVSQFIQSGGPGGPGIANAALTATSFWRFFGDAHTDSVSLEQGDRDSDLTDIQAFNQANTSRASGRRSNNPYRAHFDFDGNGLITGADRGQFMLRYGSDLPAFGDDDDDDNDDDDGSVGPRARIR